MAREKTEQPGDAASDTPRASLSVAELRQLITLMNGSDIEEIGIEEASSGLRLSLRKPAPLAAVASSADDDTLEYLIADGAGAETPSTTVEVTSPLVGLFHSWHETRRPTTLRDGRCRARGPGSLRGGGAQRLQRG